jgi:capsular exopolysaccharide synthesis family protein
MSKIEKALGRAKQNRSMALVRTPVTSNANSEVSSDTGRELSRAGERVPTVTRRASASAIARMKESALRERDALERDAIIVPESGENATVQAFRELRTRILQHTQGRNGIILVTSVAGSGGSTFVATNLGVAFAFDVGRTALLVDCNLRSPRFQNLLQGGGDGAGITDFLENPETELESIIYPVGIERLRVIPAGSKRDIPTEYFTSPRVRQLFEDIRDRYAERFVILDAPPMTESADTQILIELCDYVLVVVPYGRLTDVQIDNCIKSIDQKKLIGIVFNNEPQLPPIRFRPEDLVSILRNTAVNMYSTVRLRVRKMLSSKKKPTETAK